jgi:hypothetical protein
MSTGFGKPRSQPKPSQRAKERAKAATAYDRMKSDGTPDFEIYLRIRGKKQWYPIGVIAVKRSSQINRAIFGSQEDLLQGAFRLYPMLRKHQNQLEYGYRLKEFKDEPIQVAIPPQAGGAGLQGAFSQLQSGLAGLFRKAD